MITRRRLLLTATAAACGGTRAPEVAVWHGTALGADAHMRVEGRGAEEALAAILKGIDRDEGLVSLYRPHSALSHLNAVGHLDTPSADLVALLRLAAEMHRVTGGAFDPTVQPLWRALAEARDTDAATATIGFGHVKISDDRISLAQGQALTLNGIAQGWITDRAVETLAHRGFRHALIDLGETRALGEPHRISLVDPESGPLGTRTLNDSAIATSSPRAMLLPRAQPHIIGRPIRWSTVSVETGKAAIADALSTAFCMMTEEEVRAVLRNESGRISATLVSEDGRLQTL